MLFQNIGPSCLCKETWLIWIDPETTVKFALYFTWRDSSHPHGCFKIWCCYFIMICFDLTSYYRTYPSQFLPLIRFLSKVKKILGSNIFFLSLLFLISRFSLWNDKIWRQLKVLCFLMEISFSISRWILPQKLKSPTNLAFFLPPNSL